MFNIVITEVISLTDGEAGETIKRYEQTVDAIDLPQIIAAINRPPRAPRVRKPAQPKQPFNA